MKKTDLIRNSIITVLFAVLFVPLVFSGQFFFPFISAKNFAFRILVEIAGLLYVFLLLVDTKYRPRKSLIIASIVGFVAILGVATITSVSPFKSFWSNYERMEGYVTILHLGLYFILLASVFITEKLWEWFFEISLFASVLVGGNALFDLGRGIDRIYGTLGNSTYLGVYSLVHIFLAGFLLFKLIETHRRGNWSWWSFSKYVAFMVFNLFVMYETGTRGSFLGLIAGVILISLLVALFEKERKFLRKTAIGIFVATVAIIGLLGATKNTTFIQHSMLGRYASLITFDVGKVFREQGFGRSLIWKVALKGVQEKPILGWGQDNFNYVFNKYYTPDLWGQESWFDRAHNVFLDWLIAGGILGLLAYLFLYAALLWSVWKTSEERLGIPGKAIITGLVAAYFVHNLFVFDNLASYILFFALLAYVHQLVVLHPEKSRKIINKNIQYVVGSVAVIVFAGVMYYGIIKPYSQNLTLLQVLQSQDGVSRATTAEGKEAAFEQTYALYDKTLNFGSFGTTEAREQFALAGESVFQSANPDLKKKVDERVKSEFADQFKQTPDDARYYFVFGGYLTRVGQYDLALVNIRKAELLSPSKQQFIFDEGIVLINQGKYEEAYQDLKKAYEMATSNPMAVSMYAVGAAYAKHIDVLADLTKQNSDILNDQRVIQALVATKQFQIVIPVLEHTVASGKASLDSMLYLAAAYLEVGERDKALAVLTNMKKKVSGNTQNEAQVQYFIDQIEKGANSFF